MSDDYSVEFHSEAKEPEDVIELTYITNPYSEDVDETDDPEGSPDDDLLPELDDKIVLNVGGIRHECLVRTLLSFPHTRLCRLAEKHKPGRKEEYFFDRHPGVFSTVLDYYRSGELHVPLDVCGAVVKRELAWWGVDVGLIEACCWIKYSRYIDTQATLADYNMSERKDSDEFNKLLTDSTGWKAFQSRIWIILDHPRSSRLALGYAVTSFLFVCASIAGFCIETLPRFTKEENVTGQCGDSKVGETTTVYSSNPVLQYLDYVCTAFFTLELIIRIIFAPDKRAFFRSPMNIIDILALLPLYVQNILDIAQLNNCSLKNNRAIIEIIFILRIIRIFRIFHLMKHYKALKILLHAIKASTQELLMLLVFLFIAMLVFSTLIFYCERQGIIGEHTEPGESDKPNNFNNIPLGFWWSIVTMTTVGYGDIHPDTPLGYVVGSFCAVCGVLLIALTIPVISNNFALFYMHARTREQIANKRHATQNMQLLPESLRLSDTKFARRFGSIRRGLLRTKKRARAAAEDIPESSSFIEQNEQSRNGKIGKRNWHTMSDSAVHKNKKVQVDVERFSEGAEARET